MNTLKVNGPFKILDSVPMKKGTARHDVRVTLNSGRRLTLAEADWGMREYPHPDYNAMIVGEGAESFVIISDPCLSRGRDYDPMDGRMFSVIAETAA
jgi:hypothetical protein